MDRWRGKVAIVTGASAGIGRAITIKLANEGIKTIAIARREDVLKKLSAENPNIITYCFDITDENKLKTSIQDIIAKVGDIHILINNAGVANFGLMSEQDNDSWKILIDTNLMALCIATKEVIAHMREKKINGQIININSVAGHYIPSMEKPIMGIYPASKHAVTAATEQFRQEMVYLGTDIKITSLSPGYVYTDIHKDGGDTTNPNGMDPEDVVDGVMFILSTKPNILVKELTLKHIREKF